LGSIVIQLVVLYACRLGFKEALHNVAQSDIIDCKRRNDLFHKPKFSH